MKKCAQYQYLTVLTWVCLRGNISLLVMCRKHALRISISDEHSALILFYSWIFFFVPIKMFFLHLFLFISFEYIPSSFLSDCCLAEVELNALA